MKKVLCLCLVFLFCFIAVGSTAEGTATADVAADLFGRVEDGNYVNEFIGFGFKLDDWHFYTDEEIDQLNAYSKALLTEDYARMMDQIEMLYVMVASATDGTNINISLRNLGEYASVYETLGLETIAKSSIDTSVAQLQAAGYEDVTVEYIQKSVDGEDFSGLMTSYKLQGFEMKSRLIMCIRDRYLVSITVTGFEEDEIDAGFGKLYLLK